MNPASYIIYKIDYYELYEKVKDEEFLLSLTKGEIIIYTQEKYSNAYSNYYQKYKFIPINHHSLSSFYKPKNINAEREFWVIVGVKDYMENDKMTIFFQKWIKILNYIIIFFPLLNSLIFILIALMMIQHIIYLLIIIIYKKIKNIILIFII